MVDLGVSTALGYVLGLAIVTVMITGLFVTTGEVVENQREQAIRSELRVLGNQIAADMTSVDRLALAETGSNVRLTRSLPESVAGSPYEISIEYDGSRPATIELVSRNPQVSVTVQVMNGTRVLNTTTSGSAIAIEYNGSVMALGSANGDVLGATGELIEMLDGTVGATDVRTEVNFEIQPGSPTIGNSLNSVEIDVQSGSPDMFSGTSQSDVVEMGVDTDGDGVIDTDIQSDINGWTVSDGGSTLKVELSGSAYTNPQAGETIILVVGNVDNPTSPGTYDVRIQTSGDGNWQHGSINIT